MRKTSCTTRSSRRARRLTSGQSEKQIGTIKVGKRTFPKVVYTQHMTVRTLAVKTGGGDLIADSRVIWSKPPSTPAVYPPGCRWAQDPLASGHHPR